MPGIKLVHAIQGAEGIQGRVGKYWLNLHIDDNNICATYIPTVDLPSTPICSRLLVQFSSVRWYPERMSVMNLCIQIFVGFPGRGGTALYDISVCRTTYTILANWGCDVRIGIAPLRCPPCILLPPSSSLFTKSEILCLIFVSCWHVAKTYWSLSWTLLLCNLPLFFYFLVRLV